MKVLKDVTILWAKLDTPVDAYGGTGQQYEVSFAVNEDTADKWEVKFKKQPPKKYLTSEFKDKTGVDAPFPEQKKQFVLKLKKKLQNNDNDEKYRVRVFYNGEDITDKKLANGCVGNVVFDDFTNDFGTMARPIRVDLTKFIEYIPKDKKEEQPF